MASQETTLLAEMGSTVGWDLEDLCSNGIQSSKLGRLRMIQRIVFAIVDYNVRFAYVPTLLNWVDLVNNKARLLQGEVVRCVRRELGTAVVVE